MVTPNFSDNFEPNKLSVAQKVTQSQMQLDYQKL